MNDVASATISSTFRRPARRPWLVLAVVALSFASAHAQSKADPRSESTRKMADLLAKLAKNVDPMANRYLSTERAVVLRRRLKNQIGTPNEAKARTTLARQLLNSNQIDEALVELDLAEALVIDGDLDDMIGLKEIGADIESQRALCWMRRGELENCLDRHCCRSCILPIAEGGTHSERRGSETAIELLTKILERDPADYEAIWLLNLAHMTLGSWPAEVPERFRVPESAFASEIEFPRFPDVAAACGVDWTSLSGGVAAEDFDGDGLLDLVLTAIGHADQTQVYVSRGDGTFENRTKQAAIEGIVGGLNLIQGDYDNDGDVDLYVIRGAWYGEEGKFPDSLLRNRGDATFDDVTEEAGVLAFHPSQTAVFTDLDGDGFLDLVVGSETMRDEPLHSCLVYVNQRDGTFKDYAYEVGAELNSFVKAVVAGDYDNDGRPDLYFSCRSANNVLLKNEPSNEAPGFKFRDVSRDAGITVPRMSFPAFFFDYDNDGWLDIYNASNSGFLGDRVEDVGRFYMGIPTNSERPALYHNLRNGKFEEVAVKLGADRAIFSMGANYADVDSDGFPDFYLATGSPDLGALLPNRLFRNDAGRRFQDVTSASGTGHLQKGHGVSFADFDNDGDLDLFEHLGGGVSGDVYPASLFENPGFGNHWISLRMQGVEANRSGVGARIHVRAAKGTVERSIHVVCDIGGSFGANPLRQHVGLGDADRVLFVEIVWPGSGTRQRIENLPLDRFYRIIEGDPQPQPYELPRFKLGGSRSDQVDVTAR